jgi:hypothetical protein
MTLVFTICSNNYLAQAIRLGQSLLYFNKDYKFIIGLVDRKSKSIDYNKIPFEILEVEEIGIDRFNEMVMRYDIVELNTSVKPFYFKFFIYEGIYDSIIYMDPDIEVFAPLFELENELGIYDIIITPHFFTPINDDKWQAEEDFLNSGLYNLGFIAVRKNSNSIKMIDWWAERLRTKSYINFSKGLFTDQIWINFVPLFFERVKILKHLGYNVAYWNLHERKLTKRDNNYFINDTIPLVFYHYASFRPLNPSVISTGQTRFSFEDRPELVPLFQDYCTQLFEIGYTDYNRLPCYFVNLKEAILKEKWEALKKSIPFHKKVIGRLYRIIRNAARKIVVKFGIILDYSTLK